MSSAPAAPVPDVVPLTEPSDGVGPVVDTPAAFARVVERFAAATGPVAADAERASGYRYGQSTYLVQVRRAGAGTALLDPVALPDLSALGEAVGDAEWVLHAASQDLPGLAEHGLRPARVFDTELAARLLGMERVGLAAVVAEVLGLGLAKEHSAVDWSTRPLPTDWLRYAALDVEVLLELREKLGERLEAAGKAEWAAEEFEAVRTAPPPAPRPEPWRRTSGTHTLRDRRQLAVVRSLWAARDASARARDVSPGRVLPDRALVAAARALPRSVPQLVALPEFAGKAARRRAAAWQRAIDEALALPAEQLPSLRGPRTEGPPQPRVWADRDPVAARRLTAAREVVAALSEELSVPVENLLQPDALRRLCWTPPDPAGPAEIADFLRGRNAREWQVALVAEPLAKAFAGL
ncbi:ribonuclease D [Isoptericola variabilis]|uniref:3'-5' exonuclease n=1 Tax=Isoptericola variabilis (strain 225) TaxID=743718 RepID=F6FW35_ISOV2|nr:HRDC domain-containing protein [Isoptericola variabilis]AEG44505.1 3'-5' exonuclease [Isoptericola variabilis 225]TWH26579.1 ribonuclease D [Isoptericola variabilis J7]